jgi:2-oxoglutarate ferredoxin oxidoreductase subunit alpha
VHLLDKGIANCLAMTNLDFKVEIRRGKLESEVATEETGMYKRFRFTEDNISPRAFLGERMMWYTGDEHNELGHICEDPVIRNAMYEKRMSKYEKMVAEMPDYDKAILYGPEKYDDLLVTWGMTKGAAVDALDELNSLGRNVAVLQVRMMEPFPADYVAGFIKRAGSAIAVEANYLGLLAELIEAKCQIRIPNRIVKYNGRLVSQDEIVAAYKKLSKGDNRIVLSGGE